MIGFWSIAKENPDHLALVAPDGREILAAELLASSNRVVHGLRALGLRRGDTIAMLMKNAPEMIELFLAAQQAGWYITPINSHLVGPEVAYILQDSGAKAFFADARCTKAAQAAAREVNLPAETRFALGAIDGFRPYAAVKEGQPGTTPEDRKAGAAMTYTSGTTGRPKGVRRPLADMGPDEMAMNHAGFLMLFGIMPGEPGVHLVGSPLYHTAVLNFCMNHLHLGHTVVLMEKWEAEESLRLIEKYGVTNSHMVPTQFARLLNLPEATREKYDLSSLRHMIHSAAPCPVDVKRKMLAWWGPVIYEYYAASEGGGTLATPQDWLRYPGTVGNPWPISEVKILDDDGNALAPGEVGTVYMRMGGIEFEYHKDKDKTSKAWRDGFFTVGDAGYLNEDGFLFLRDRKTDMIISGGVNIYPAEIESQLIGHPKIADVAVFGIPNEDWGEEVKAVVEPAEGVVADEALRAELAAWCQENVAGYKRPRTIDFMAELPRDPNGKLYKRRLRERYWEGHDSLIG
ncbi:MAG: acyl-CoA synthetase [Myxococcales bacterium]|nr:acyl-CoA synthetase [Myxococcales bacterium]